VGRDQGARAIADGGAKGAVDPAVEDHGGAAGGPGDARRLQLGAHAARPDGGLGIGIAGHGQDLRGQGVDAGEAPRPG